MTRGGAAVLALVGLAGCAGGDDAGSVDIAPASVVASSGATPSVASSVLTSADTAVAAAPTTTSGTSDSTTTTTSPTSSSSTTSTSTTSTSTTSTSTTSTSTTVPPVGTACREVVHIGDSTAIAMWAAADVGGDPAATMTARYGSVGVESVYPDVSGGRSMVERLPGQTNALDVAEAVRAGGYAGCWVIMIGTNDAANVAAGGVPGLDARIAALLEATDGMPVLWVNTVSRSSDPVWSDANMQQFNAALARATAEHPNLRVLDWAGRVRPEWLTPDGLHYTTEGRIWRAAITAAALADAFPG